MEPFPSAFGNWEGREDAIRSLKCLDAPMGCGRALDPSEVECWDGDTKAEYRITGMCRFCQDEVYDLFEEMEDRE